MPEAAIVLVSTILVFTKRALHKLSAEQVQLKMRHTANAATKLAVTVVETWSADPADKGQLWRVDSVSENEQATKTLLPHKSLESTARNEPVVGGSNRSTHVPAALLSATSGSDPTQ